MTPTPTNATGIASAQNSVGGYGDATTLAVVLVLVLTAGGALYFLSTAERYARLLGIYEHIVWTIKHAAIGAVAVAGIGAVAYSVYQLVEVASRNPAKTGGALVAIVIGVPIFAGIGYLTRRVGSAVSDRHEDVTGEPLIASDSGSDESDRNHDRDRDRDSDLGDAPA